jgi:hypothetical protein
MRCAPKTNPDPLFVSSASCCSNSSSILLLGREWPSSKYLLLQVKILLFNRLCHFLARVCLGRTKVALAKSDLMLLLPAVDAFSGHFGRCFA